MVMEIFKNHHLVTIATTKRDRTCQPTVTTYFLFNIFCTSILTISELAKILWHVQYKILRSAPSVILSIPDEGYSRNLALTLISTLLFLNKLLCHHDIGVDSFIICWILIQFILHGTTNILRYLFYPLYSQLKWEILLFNIVYTFVLHFVKICEISINWIMCPWPAIIVLTM